MGKPFEKAVAGFNHNIKHNGKLYHVQTEDSGINNPHIITHLFVGGNIVASKKTSYADMRHMENLPEVVRELMQEQHKDMLRSLIRGAYEHVEAANAVHYQPGQLATPKPAAAVPPAPAPPAPPVPAAPKPPVAAVPEISARTQEEPLQKEAPRFPPPPEDRVSEKTLDELISSYLAGDSES